METLTAESQTIPRQPRLSRALRACFAAAVLLVVAGAALRLWPAAAPAALALRWIGLALFIPVAWQRRSLLVWTFWAMIAGARPRP